MKTALFICAIFFGVQTIFGQQSITLNSKNLLSDGAVSGNTLWRKYTGTNKETGGKPDTCCLIDPTVGKTAKGSILLVGNGSREWRTMMYNTPIPVEPGKKYHFSAWVKTENISSNSKLYFGFTLKTKNEEGKSGNNVPRELSPKFSNMASDKLKGTHDWTLIETVYTIPETAYFLVVLARLDPVIEDTKNSKVWFDDMVIEEVK